MPTDNSPSITPQQDAQAQPRSSPADAPPTGQQQGESSAADAKEEQAKALGHGEFDGHYGAEGEGLEGAVSDGKSKP